MYACCVGLKVNQTMRAYVCVFVRRAPPLSPLSLSSCGEVTLVLCTAPPHVIPQSATAATLDAVIPTGWMIDGWMDGREGA